MLGLRIFITIYLIIGTVYTAYIHSKAPRSVFWIPVNIIFGPITALYVIISSIRGKRLPIDWR